MNNTNTLSDDYMIQFQTSPGTREIFIIARGVPTDELPDHSAQLRSVLHSYFRMIFDNSEHPLICLPIMLPIDVLCASILLDLQSEFGKFDIKYYEKIRYADMPTSYRDQWYAISKNTPDGNIIDSTLDEELLLSSADFALYVLCGTSWNRRARAALKDTLSPNNTSGLTNLTIFCI